MAENETLLERLKREIIELNKTAQNKMSEFQALTNENDSKNLKTEVESIKSELSKIEETFESAKDDLKEQIRHTNTELEGLKEKEEGKRLRLDELTKEIDSLHYQLRNGENLITKLKEEWENIPKEISRSLFVKKIKDIQSNLGKQRHIFAQIHNELEALTSSIRLQDQTLNRVYIEFENSLISKDPKRSDLLYSRIFAVYNEFKQVYAKTISNLEVQEKLKKESQSLEVQVEILKSKKYEEKLEQLRQEILEG